MIWYIAAGIVVGIKTFIQLLVKFDQNRLPDWSLVVLTVLSAIFWPVSLIVSVVFGII